MLCLDGCQCNGEPRPNNRIDSAPHGHVYCARASIAMMASYYGGNVSQDRVSYQIFKGETPEGELGHDFGFSNDQVSAALTWALGVNVPTQSGKPTFAQIKTWVDANQPVITKFVFPDLKSAHVRVLDGYFEVGIHQYIHLLDPATQDTGAGKEIGWVKFADDNDHVTAYHVGPSGTKGAPNVQSDDPYLKQDTDGDGINDFDEIKRFKTDPTGDDSDLDWVKDKQEIVDYTFNTKTGDHSPKPADIDGDTWRKELDPDNDGGGLIDGCEDINHSDNFKPDDDKVSSTTLIYPSGNINSSHPTYKWNAVCGANSYWLLVDDTTGRGKIFKPFSASEAGCASGTGTCSVTPSISIADGNATWWIDPCHSRGCGDWSNALGFIVNTKDLPQSWVAGYTKPTGPFMATSFVMEKKDFVPAANKVVLGEGLGKSQAIENACREFDFLSEWHMCCCYYYGQHGSYKVCIDNSDWNRCKIIQP